MNPSPPAAVKTAAFATCISALFALGACEAKLPGSYELDFEETKAAVLAAAQANPAEQHKQADVLKLLSDTRLNVRLDEGGTFETTTQLVNGGAVTPPPRSGKWTRDGKKLTLMMEGDENTSCDVDGKRLRCQKPMMEKLFENYVLVRK